MQRFIAAEKKIFDDIADGFDELPLWLVHRIEVYARAQHAYNVHSHHMRNTKSSVADLYKMTGVSAMLLKQVDSANASIERERKRQREEANIARKENVQLSDYDAA